MSRVEYFRQRHLELYPQQKADPEFMACKAARSSARRSDRRDFVDLVKATCGCVDCGEQDTRVLDLDHQDPSLKYKAIAHMVMHGNTLPAIIAEIKKCDVRCANCHRRRTFIQRTNGDF